ncbi:MAG TPA: type VI secretion system tip protein VgrG, partial [Candidatus Sulfopaludibacter sp.]|nr:type VI secretion system tip protein VgrG [Candidatus Sulfopaludibacter sp.]
MPTLYTQEDRPVRITTSLGKDTFIVTSFSGSEYVSGLYQFEINVVWQGGSTVTFSDILGQNVSLAVDVYGITRQFHGIVKSISQGHEVTEHNLILYTITMVPKLWLLTRRVNCKIFQNLNALEIVKQVLSAGGITNMQDDVHGAPKTRDYCVQYYETDFDFISRLMEFEGLFYHFDHTDSKETLVLCNDNTSFLALPHGAEVQFEPIVGGLRAAGRIYEWRNVQEINSGKFSMNDYNFETPAADLYSSANTAVNLSGNGDLNVYENPGGYSAHGDGDALAKIRKTEEEARTHIVQGRSVNVDIQPGYKFTLAKHFKDNGEYKITGVTHLSRLPLDTGNQTEGFVYENQFTCIPADNDYRPPRVTPQPRIEGVQTAVVVGTSGEEIYTDQYGRVKVQFHWDRDGKKDENSSCWVRVATYWAGKNWGAIHIPRIGQEVVVDFVEGDVDRPIIVGSVYNAGQPVPYTLPDNKTQSTLKSNSSKGGGGFNEIRLEDKKGSEEVYFHAEKDLNSVVENNESRKVGSAGKKCTDGNRVTEIYKDETLTVKTGNQTTTVEKGNQATTIKMGNQTDEVSMGNQSTTIKMGNQSTKLDLGAATHEAMQSITLKVGQNSIVIDQMGITIKGLMISVEGQVTVKVTAPITQVNGDGMTT